MGGIERKRQRFYVLFYDTRYQKINKYLTGFREFVDLCIAMRPVRFFNFYKFKKTAAIVNTEASTITTELTMAKFF